MKLSSFSIDDQHRSGVYKIVNLTNGKCYYGSAGDSFMRRWNSHVHKLNNNKHENSYLQRAWNKYGAHNFDFKIILFCDKKYCVYYEQFYLDMYYDVCNYCYNINPTAGSCLGRKLSNDTKQKISDKVRGREVSKETRIKLSEAGKKRKHTEAEKAKIRISNMTREITEQTKNKISETRIKLGTAAGENNPKSKLSRDDVVLIRKLNKAGLYTIKQIAVQFSVMPCTIRSIIRNQTWKNI